jgi:GNAT superfamily N-acetyltransferase
MRLTVHHSAELQPDWLDSLNKLLAADSLNREKLLHAGHWHVATFNDRVVGLAVTKDEELIYLAVRDATRRRGVGQHLLNETLAWMRSQGCTQAMLSTHAARPEEHQALTAFLLHNGFTRNGQRFLLTLKN